MTILKNGETWKDTDGNPIHAHGGYVIRVGQYYYWYGEDRGHNYYINCYRSTDLLHWEFRNHVLTTDSPVAPAPYPTDLMLARDPDGDYGEPCDLLIDDADPFHKVNIERPKVLYNEKLRQYVMWAHFENGVNYREARAAIATCDTPDGNFVYRGSFNPLGNMSRDCTLFLDDDGTAYFISTARGNADLNVYRLTDDYLGVAEQVNCLFPGGFREAPVFFKRNGRYYIMNSDCTGWDPNQCKYSSAASMDGEWAPLENCADETTYDTQPAYILTLAGTDGTQFIYVGDRWSGSEYFSSSYVALPIEFDEQDHLILPFHAAFTLDVERGTYMAVD